MMVCKHWLSNCGKENTEGNNKQDRPKRDTKIKRRSRGIHRALDEVFVLPSDQTAPSRRSRGQETQENDQLLPHLSHLAHAVSSLTDLESLFV